jgi:nitrous oxide reductase accessory protein NosL
MATPKVFLYALLVLLFTYVTTGLSQATDPGRCGQCGMELSGYPHTLYEITWTNGTVTKTCGVQCGLIHQLKHADKYRSSVARDLLSNRSFDAGAGYYVFGATVVTDMGPGFITFDKKINAEKFQKGFGGKVMSFHEALTVWKNRKRARP